MRRLAIAAVLAALLGPSPCLAQFVNGDFSEGSKGWTTSGDPDAFRFSFPTDGLNPCALVEQLKPSAEGTACLEQTFQCQPEGEASTCTILLDYKVAARAVESAPVVVSIRVDGQELVASAHAFVTPWTTLTATVPKGTHQVQICFTGEAGGNAVEFDDIRVQTSVPVRATAWSAIKTRY